MTTDQPIETQAVVVAQLQGSMAVSNAMRLDDILAQVKLIQDVMHRVMKEKEHYGSIPGCGEKKTLLQPGAQKLTMTFRLAPSYEIQEVTLARDHKEYRVTCTLKSIQSGSFVGQGVGCCSTMESKYRWRGGSRKCPKCGKEGTVIKGKAQYGGGWLCWTKKGGCDEKWPDGAQEIEGQSIEKVENENPADCYNTVLKIAKKRAFVDATITATAASDIFTQDIGDDEGGTDDSGYVPKSTGKAPESSTTHSDPEGSFEQAEPSKDAPKATPATTKTRSWAIGKIGANEPGPRRTCLYNYMVALKWIKPDNTVEAWPLDKVPVNGADLQKLLIKIGNFEADGRAEA